jgi:DNA-binding GntR family transcriptional regulator
VISHLEESERFFYIGARSRDVNVETNRDHAGIVEVLRRRDAAAAAAAAAEIMAEHIENTRLGLNASILKASSAAVSL